jgi:hypothetical protein
VACSCRATLWCSVQRGRAVPSYDSRVVPNKLLLILHAPSYLSAGGNSRACKHQQAMRGQLLVDGGDMGMPAYMTVALCMGFWGNVRDAFTYSLHITPACTVIQMTLGKNLLINLI